ncbi:ABC transporter ATP-binding protein [Candidatus Woesearchaeota archaeon]|nr:ABC transporter ATP-binding protein [Candidatus Woesearchaeota archaeon]
METAIAVSHLKKMFGKQLIFQDLSFDINQGDIVAFFGPNGCGKSTILNIIANLVEKDHGECRLNFKQQEISYVFQNYRDSLLPWSTIYDNLFFPLMIQNGDKTDQNQNTAENVKIIDELRKMLDIKFNFEKYPYELSGGQQQIIAFARALVNKPKLLLIDEPFSALDYENNLLLRTYLQDYYLKYNPTILVITHNIEEAVHLANKIIVFSKNPTQIIGVINNGAPYPRDISFLSSEIYNQTKDKVLLLFKEALQ